MKIEIDVLKIGLDQIEAYILNKRDNASEFDELSKRESIIRAMVTDLTNEDQIEDVEELFAKIIMELKNNMKNKITDEEILEIDFYDFCGVGSVGMSDQDKIDWYRKYMINNSTNDKK